MGQSRDVPFLPSQSRDIHSRQEVITTTYSHYAWGIGTEKKFYQSDEQQAQQAYIRRQLRIAECQNLRVTKHVKISAY